MLTPQVSIDGFRLTAERTGCYDGQTPAQWCGEDGEWTDVWLREEPPRAARVGVFRKGFRDALYAVARFDSYAQTTKEGKLTRMWMTMGDLMIAKCAEALALRKAFPAELSGVYSPDEMGTISAQPVVEARQAPQLGPKAAQVVEAIRAADTTERLLEIAKQAEEAGLDGEDKKAAKRAWAQRHNEVSSAEADEPQHNPDTGEVQGDDYAHVGPPPMTDNEIAHAEEVIGTKTQRITRNLRASQYRLRQR